MILIPTTKGTIREGEPVEIIQSILETTEISVEDLSRTIQYAIESSACDSAVICTLVEHEPATARFQHNDGMFLLHTARLKNSSTQVIRFLIDVYPDALDIPSGQEFDRKFPIHLLWSSLC